jgi:hypothetical protein
MARNDREITEVKVDDPIKDSCVRLKNTTSHEIDLCYMDANKLPQRINVPAAVFEGNGNNLVSHGEVIVSKELMETLMLNPAISAYFAESYLVMA